MCHCRSITRKPIDQSGRLGSLYDAFFDKICDDCQVKRLTDLSTSDSYSICRILSGTQFKNDDRLLEELGFENEILQSFHLNFIKPAGLASIINYNRIIDGNNIFFYYSYISKQEKLYLSSDDINIIVSLPRDSNRLLYMINEIVWGFEILFYFSTFDEHVAKTIENQLHQISERISGRYRSTNFTDEQYNQIDELSNAIIFSSNECIMNNQNMSFRAAIEQLSKWQNDPSFHCPIVYKMIPIELLYQNQNSSKIIDEVIRDNSHWYELKLAMINMNNQIKCIEAMVQTVQKMYLDSDSNIELKDVSTKFESIMKLYQQFQMKIRQRASRATSRNKSVKKLEALLKSEQYIPLSTKSLDQFHDEVKQCLEKIKLIQLLNSKSISYIDIFNTMENNRDDLNELNIDKTINNIFSKMNQFCVLWYSNETLRQDKLSEWQHICDRLLLRRQQSNNEIKLFYLDFSQCSLPLEDFIIKDMQNEVYRMPSLAVASVRRSINILILGETGVGKSTFINAFVNYLLFNTLQQAEQNQPVFIIPASFLITTAHQFEENIVTIGEEDPNENLQNQGQSVTQRCRSYLLNLSNTFRLRLIDTPGFGDTRGVHQDEFNMNHILTYINQISHVNAICLLLKPNNSKLNVLFRSCIRQLLSYITPDGFDNIIFCFTNSRSTFFAPGDTGPSLKAMLKEKDFDGIRFEKRNTFCFDSESFRYLVARNCNVEFDDYVRQESIESWKISVTESERFMDFVQTLTPYHLNEHKLTLKRVAIEMLTLARPLMEKMRLLTYNLILHERQDKEHEIILTANYV